MLVHVCAELVHELRVIGLLGNGAGIVQLRLSGTTSWMRRCWVRSSYLVAHTCS
jgi:hypothetical protein